MTTPANLTSRILVGHVLRSSGREAANKLDALFFKKGTRMLWWQFGEREENVGCKKVSNNIKLNQTVGLESGTMTTAEG